MTEREGVIKYRLDYRPGPACSYPELAELNAWRTVLHRLDLIGQDPGRYEGLAFGNLSFRLGDTRQFVITGSQTGGLNCLTRDHYSRVRYADPERNHLIAEGAMKPSSEALTHAAVYQADNRVRAVVHAHSPLIWRHCQALDLAVIDAAIRYGTPAMAKAVFHLTQHPGLNEKPIFVMLGHEDGVVAYGDSVTDACQILIRTLAAALQTTGQWPE
ncbi:MAG: class II aldolase/adducin family protein [Gammaproteobacteria bacterium]